MNENDQKIEKIMKILENLVRNGPKSMILAKSLFNFFSFKQFFLFEQKKRHSFGVYRASTVLGAVGVCQLAQAEQDLVFPRTFVIIEAF